MVRFRLPMLLLLALAPAPARATLIGTPFSGTTSADAAAVFWNPAAMSLIRGTEGMAYGTLTPIRVTYERDYLHPITGQPYPTAKMLGLFPEVFVGAVTDATLRDLRFGVGFADPIIDGAQWFDTAEGQPTPARYYGIDTYLAWMTVSPAVSYRVTSWLAVGAGVDLVIALMHNRSTIDMAARINQATCKAVASQQCRVHAPLPREDPTWDGEMRADGTAFDVGAFAGILLTPAPWLRIGATFRTGSGRVDIPTDVTVQMPAAVVDYVARNLPSLELPPVQGRTDIRVHFPMMVFAGVMVSPTERLDLHADFQWMDKSRMSTFMASVVATNNELLTDQVVYNPFFDYYSVGLRGAFRALPRLRLALGLAYEPSTRPRSMASPTTTDMHKVIVRAGVAWRPLPWLTATLEYAHYFLVTQRIARSQFNHIADPTTAQEQGIDRPRATGTYSGAADRVGVGVQVHY